MDDNRTERGINAVWIAVQGLVTRDSKQRIDLDDVDAAMGLECFVIAIQ
jgi:hypothetical protein